MATGVNFGTQQYFGFNPLTIPDCYIWSDANTLSGLANGTTVSSWSNLGSGGTVTATGTVSNAVLNTRPVVNFTTAQTWVTGTVVNLSTYSMFAVSRQTGGTNRRVLQSTTNNQLFGYWNGYKRAIYIDANPNQLTTALSDTNWDIMSHTRITSGAYTFNWNGTSLFSSGSSAATNLTGLAINTGCAPGETSTCQIAEIILYSSVLTASQVQQIEGYLAWKWGLQANLSINHPFKYYTPAMRIFQPSDIENLTLWLDAADATTLTTSGTTVTQWRDKSGNLNHSTATGGFTTYPTGTINSVPAVLMNNSWLTGPFAAAFTGTQVHAFAVATMTTSAGSFARLLSLGRPGVNDYNQTTTTFMMIRNTAQNIMIGRNSSYLTLSLPAYSTPFLVQSSHNGAIESIGLNGIVSPSTQNTGVAGAFNITSYGIGTNTNTADTQYWNGFIGEVLYYTGVLTTSQRQQIEGYLANKWGLSSLLPAAHPYYLLRSVPSTPVFNPHLIANCALWFDGAETSTITGTSPVTAWVNKGTITTTAANFTGTPTSGNTYNGLNYIALPSGAEMRFTAAINTQARSWFFVARMTTAFTASPQYWGVINATAGGQDGIVTAYNGSTFEMYIGPNGVAVTVSANITNPLNRVGIYSIVNSVTPSLNALTDNGTSRSLINSVAAAGFNTGSAAVIIGTGGYNRGGDIMEILLYYGDLTPSNRQRVEGYLAWKWGLQANLPTTHPYYKFRP